MRTVTIQARPVLPRLHARRGLLEPYDLVLIAGGLVALAVGVLSGYPLIEPQAWMLPNIALSAGFFAVCLVLLLSCCLVVMRVRHQRLPANALRVAIARYLQAPTLLRALRFAVVFELVRLPATTLTQRLPWFRAMPHRPDLPQVFDSQVLWFEKLIHFGWDIPVSLASLNWPGWMTGVMDQVAMHWLILPGVMVVYALTSSHRAQADRFLVALLAVWLACPLVALVLPTTGPFLMQQEVFSSQGMTATHQTQQAMFHHWVEHLFPQRDGALVFGYGLMGFPSLPAAAVGVCIMFGWRASRPARHLVTVGAAIVVLSTLIAGWHHTVGVYAGALLAVGAWWCAGLLIQHTSGARPSHPDDMLRDGQHATARTRQRIR